MKTQGIQIRERLLVPSRSTDSMHGLLAETRDILTKHFGVGAATARSHIDCLLSTGSRGTTLYALPRARGKEHAKTSIKRPMKISNTQALMAELFAQKREEKTPENFLRDFIEEFHRRIEPSATKARPPESARKVAQS